MHLAAKEGRLDVVRFLHTHSPQLVFDADDCLNTALMVSQQMHTESPKVKKHADTFEYLSSLVPAAELQQVLSRTSEAIREKANADRDEVFFFQWIKCTTFFANVTFMLQILHLII